MTSQHQRPESGQRAFLHRILSEGADRLGVSLIGEAVFGWHDRTIGSAALDEQGGRFWIRATAEHHDWAGGDMWTGNRDAGQIAGVPRPMVIARDDWDEPPVAIYAELMSHVPDSPCSPTPELTTPLDLPDPWWSHLRQALDTLATHPTDRGDREPRSFISRVENYFGCRLDHPLPGLRTEHTDLHWGNLTQPRLWLLDWESWGSAPTGSGPATLYLHSLLVPDMANRVDDVFADLLHSPTGRLAQLSAAALILDRADRMGDYPDLRRPVGEHAVRLLASAAKR